MIQATELRIGNYLTYHTPDDTDMPCKIDAQDILNISTNYMHNAEIHSPIPLTEEILLKCGFELSYKGLHTTYEINEGIVTYYFWDDRQYASFKGADIKCEYLHTLQNLIFILTNTELNITL